MTCRYSSADESVEAASLSAGPLEGLQNNPFGIRMRHNVLLVNDQPEHELFDVDLQRQGELFESYASSSRFLLIVTRAS